MIRKSARVLLAVSCLALPAGLLAESRSAYLQPESVTGIRPLTQSEKMPEARFAPAAERQDHRLDWAHWDEALNWLVIPMGPSLRDGAPRVSPATGTRRIYGHDSRLRLEGNRVAFSFVTPEIVTALGDYRADLERIGSTLDLARLPRNEQLAFWLNLHNVAVIEALARAYPLPSPQERTFGPDDALLDDAKLVTVAGVALSPRDIRERIVYPNWRDPKVIYGFWRGQIGGPSIQRLAFTGENVDQLLALSGEEFVNSLRGIEAWGDALRLSKIFEEAAPFYFKEDAALRSHLGTFARPEVAVLVNRHAKITFKPLESDLADIDRGERDSGANFVCTGYGGGIGSYPLAVGSENCTVPGTRVSRAAHRLMEERAAKLLLAQRRGIRLGTVIVGNGESAASDPRREVE